MCIVHSCGEPCLIVWTLPLYPDAAADSGHCMTVFVCLSLIFVFVFCICSLYLSLSLSLSVPSPALSLVSCWSSSYIFAIATYPHHRQLPTLGYCFCKFFNKLSATLNVKFILPSYWLSFCQSSNQQSVTLVCSIYFSRIVPRESNAHGYLYFPFQSLYKCSKHETRNWINMRIILASNLDNM